MKGNKFFINEFDLNADILNEISLNKVQTSAINLNVGDLSLNIKNIFTPNEVSRIIDDIATHNWIPVGTDGIKNNYKENDTIGSYRLSCYEEQLADIIWHRIKGFFPTVRTMKDNTPTDWDGQRLWQPIGVNPLFRFIRYTEDGILIPHYDAPFINDNEVRSLTTLIIYLSNNDNGGGTRFIKDSQMDLPLNQRDYTDWNKEAIEDMVLFKVNPSKGDGLIFDHRILHDSEIMKSKEAKTIMRTDIMYRRVYE